MLFFYFSGDTNQQYFKVRPINSSVQEGGRVMIPCVVGKRMGIVQWAKDGFAFVIQPGKLFVKENFLTDYFHLLIHVIFFLLILTLYLFHPTTHTCSRLLCIKPKSTSTHKL